MTVVKLPKKLRDIFGLIRSGEVERGINNLSSIENFEIQKGIVLAQVYYYKSDYDSAMTMDENSLLYNDRWYSGNILSEHFYAYTYAAIQSNQVERAIKFYNFFLEVKEQLDLQEHLINEYKYKVQQHSLKLKGNKNLQIDHPPINLILNGGRDKSDFEIQLKKYRPKLNPESIDGIEYLLHFMITDCNSVDVFEYYERNADKIRLENLHLDMARLYAVAGKVELAEKTLIRYAEKSWWPIEHLQVLPMQIFMYTDLLPILTSELKLKILTLSKSNLSS